MSLHTSHQVHDCTPNLKRCIDHAYGCLFRLLFNIIIGIIIIVNYNIAQEWLLAKVPRNSAHWEVPLISRSSILTRAVLTEEQISETHSRIWINTKGDLYTLSWSQHSNRKTTIGDTLWIIFSRTAANTPIKSSRGEVREASIVSSNILKSC